MLSLFFFLIFNRIFLILLSSFLGLLRLLKGNWFGGLEISELQLSGLLSFLNADFARTVEDIDLVIAVVVLDLSFLEFSCLAQVVGYFELEVF